MKRLNIALFVAAGLVCVAAAKADTIVMSSNTNVMYTAGPSQYTGASSNTIGPYSGSSVTYNLGPSVTPWMTAIAGSSWVSFDPGTAPGGVHDSGTSTNADVPNGTYTYGASISGLTAGWNYVATFNVMADDTADVWLDGVHVINAGSGEAEHCVDGTTGPTCTMVYTGTFAFTANGSDSMVFDVEQLFGSAEGLDFAVDVAPTPEPSSLMLLGTGLLGAAGALRRRIRA